MGDGWRDLPRAIKEAQVRTPPPGKFNAR